MNITPNVSRNTVGEPMGELAGLLTSTRAESEATSY